MKRNEFYNILLDQLEIENGEIISGEEVSENSELEKINFTSLKKLGVISIIDIYMNKIISGKDLINCKTIRDIINLAYLED